MRKHNQNQTRTPVGVVPRRQAGAIGPLMSDTYESCTVDEGVEPSDGAAAAAWSRWLPSVALVTVVAGTLEWLKLTR